jgi:hypothetical protein
MFIADETHRYYALRFPASHLQLDIQHPLFRMTSLIEGWFQLTNGRPFVDTTASPRKNKSYLSIYDSCTPLGPLSSEVFADCELRLFSPANQPLENKVVHIHGRFSIIAVHGEDEPHLEIEVHRFVVMDALDPAGEATPDDLSTSVTLYGRVTLIPDTIGTTADKFFTLEVRDYIRDHHQTFSIRFVPPLRLLRCLLIHSSGAALIELPASVGRTQQFQSMVLWSWSAGTLMAKMWQH